MWIVLTKDRYPSHMHNNLKARKVEPVEVLERINPNVYHLKLLSHLNTSDVFNVNLLVPFAGHEDDSSEEGPDSRANPLREGESDGVNDALAFLERFDHLPKLISRVRCWVWALSLFSTFMFLNKTLAWAFIF